MSLKYDPITDFFTWPTHWKESISPHFYTFEFESHDPACAIQTIRGDLIHKLELCRTEYETLLKEKSPDARPSISPTSGYRTVWDMLRLKEQGYEVATGVSQHELGAAVDVMAEDIPMLLTVCEKHFDAIGVGSHFLHVDLRSDKKRRWYYNQRKM